MPLNQVRIIGGQWRGRKINLAKDVPGLRPTPDRIRETLFNWLAPVILQARCLDLFAGSGALGFEALSRGAATVYFIDHNSKVIKEIRDNAIRLQALEKISLQQMSLSLKQLLVDESPYDIVFLDPPYYQAFILPTLQWLLDQHYVHKNSLIYFEAEKEFSLILPAEFEWVRHQTTATLQYGLLRVI
jgi:16S rRNA (guanine966-N2)-methyltransferase